MQAIAMPLVALLAIPNTALCQQSPEIEAEPSGGFSLKGSLSVRESITKPLVDVEEGGDVWVRTRDMRVNMDSRGLTVLPVFGVRSPQEWPVRFEVKSAQRGSISLDVSPLRRSCGIPRWSHFPGNDRSPGRALQQWFWNNG